MPRGSGRAADPQSWWGERDLRMSWLKKLGKDRRGSRPRCVLLTDGSPEQVARRLTQIICRPEVEVSPGDQWRPQGTSEVREAQLDKAPKCGAVLLPDGTQQSMAEETEARARLEAVTSWLRGGTGDSRAGLFGSRVVSERDLLVGTAFSMSGMAKDGGSVALWPATARASSC